MGRYLAALLSLGMFLAWCSPASRVCAQNTLGGMRASIEPDNQQEKRSRKKADSRRNLWDDDSREDSSFLGGLITSFLFGDDDDDDEEEIEYAGFHKTVADPPEPEKKKGLSVQ